MTLYYTIHNTGFFLQSRKKHLETFSHFRTISLQHKGDGTRLLSPESECTSCLASYRTTNLRLRILENQKISRKFLKYLGFLASTQPVNPKANIDICARKSRKVSCKTFHRKTCFT